MWNSGIERHEPRVMALMAALADRHEVALVCHEHRQRTARASVPDTCGSCDLAQARVHADFLGVDRVVKLNSVVAARDAAGVHRVASISTLSADRIER